MNSYQISQRQAAGDCSDICPFLATAEDPTTALGFPSTANCCMRVSLKHTVPLEHQQAVCLSADYHHCPQFHDIPMPIEIAARTAQSRSQQLARLALLIALLAFLAAAVLATMPNLEEFGNPNPVRALNEIPALFQPQPTPTLAYPAE